MGMILLTDLVTGETAGMIGNGHEKQPLWEMGDFLTEPFRRGYAYTEYSGEGGQAEECSQSIKRFNSPMVVKLKIEMRLETKRATQEVDMKRKQED